MGDASSPFRTASVQQKQWRPLIQQAPAGEAASNCYMEVAPLSPKGRLLGNNDDDEEDEGVVGDDDRLDLDMADGEDAEEEEDWIEVSNKGNQTPSHWVYSDMIGYGLCYVCLSSPDI